LKDFNLAKSEVFLFLPFISDVNKLSRVTEAIVAKENGLLGIKFADKF
jgi:hypothetical protein